LPRKKKFQCTGIRGFTLFKNDRRHLIKEKIFKTKRVDVSSLSHELAVSEVTIRKDLENLEKSGILIRTHGGAVLNEVAVNPADNLYSTVVTEEQHSQAIAKLIAHLVHEEDLLFLGAGILCTKIAQELKLVNNLSIITNNASAAIELSENSEININMPPGQILRRAGYCSLTGMKTLDFLENVYVDKAIIGVDSVKFNTGFSVQDDDLCKIYKYMLNNADERILVMNGENFNKNAFAVLGPLTLANVIVSDEQMPEEYMNYFYENNIKVFTSYNIEDV
jgi:DeoR/GlpR family transcriptional regulator of sugar metabolism